MKLKPRYIGDKHVVCVKEALYGLINNKLNKNLPITAIKTAKYIYKLYPNIKKVLSKFDTENSNKSNDLYITLDNEQVIPVNLFIIKNNGVIQPKNIGAKSFLEKYFLSYDLQIKFNKLFEVSYKKFLNQLVTQILGKQHYIKDTKELKKIVNIYFPKFTDTINPYRDEFLYSLREHCFTLLKDYYNNNNEGFLNAFNNFFMVNELTIITRYGDNKKDITVEKLNFENPDINSIDIYKKGRNTVGIRYGNLGLTLRFKFESGPCSSIKLATSYEYLNSETNNQQINNNTITKFEELMCKHKYVANNKRSNAIGKCHEAITYYYFLKKYRNISQVEIDECVVQLNTYYHLVKADTLEKLFKSTSTIIEVIENKLTKKYQKFDIKSIELVPESYIENKLDTGDIELVLKVDKIIISEKISLKAVSKRGSKITTKNPGIGTILGEDYFNIGSIQEIINETKESFSMGKINHRESLEQISYELGKKLQSANQEQLKRGIENLLGEYMIAITFYEQGMSYCIEHDEINSDVKVCANYPTKIQNTLTWNYGQEEISLRVKFSKGHQHGWSTIKLTSEYKLR